jgi:hypothetical protein
MTTVAAPRTRRGPKQPQALPARSSRALLLPLGFIALLAAFSLLPQVNQNRQLVLSILGAAGALLVGLALVWRRVRRRNLRVEVSVRAQHYLQASMQASVFLYWGWYWRPAYEAVPLIAAQLAFAYAFDMLLAWSRRDAYTLGFGPFPVIFSTNLFLWFKPEWFYLQFCMVAVGFAAKELIRWDKGGRPGHIFNPSSFPLAVFSLGLILTGTTSWTYGAEIARTQFNPPNIYVLLFLVGLPGQLLFGVGTMTMSAVVTTYLFGLAYYGITGTYFFVDSYIPIAVFLGMTLLFTDPSTSPRTELGRIIFGMLYGLGNVVLYAIFREVGIPAFYDKLLPVPVLNLSIKAIDGLAQSHWLSKLSPANLGAGLSPRRRNLAYVTLWTAVFVTLLRLDGVGDNHPGHKVLFWQQACASDKANACENLSLILDTYCRDGSGWACNEGGALRWHRRVSSSDSYMDNFSRACSVGTQAGCDNAAALQQDASIRPRQSQPALRDYPVVLRTGKGAIHEQTPVEIYGRACTEGWLGACHDLAAVYLQAQGVARDTAAARGLLQKACDGGIAGACSDLGYMYYSADGVPRDEQKALGLLKKACDIGLSRACSQHKELQGTRQSATASPTTP